MSGPSFANEYPTYGQTDQCVCWGTGQFDLKYK